MRFNDVSTAGQCGPTAVKRAGQWVKPWVKRVGSKADVISDITMTSADQMQVELGAVGSG